MSAFFHGWRRKIGVLTLVIACVTTSFWIRSQSHEDILSIGCSPRTIVTISSRLNVLEWQSESRFGELDEYPEGVGQFEWSSEPLYSSEPVRHFLNQGMRHAWYGLQVGWKQGSALCTFVVLLPYWSIVIPLITISAYLILSKPRMAKSTLRPTQV